MSNYGLIIAVSGVGLLVTALVVFLIFLTIDPSPASAHVLCRYGPHSDTCNPHPHTHTPTPEPTSPPPPPPPPPPPASSPEIDIAGLLSSIQEGSSDSFTMRGSSLNSSHSYSIRVEASNSDIGFNSSCSDTSETAAVPSNRTSYSTTFTLYGCDTSGGTVTATLRRSSRFSTVTVDTDSQFVSVTAPPAAPAPTGLTVTSSDRYSVSLSWRSVSDAYRYKLERREGTSGSWSTISSGISGTSVTAGGLDCNTTYYFKVSARGDGSPYSTTFGGASGSVSRTTSECQTAPAPTGLTVTSSDQDSVALSWSSVSGAYRYKLERREGTSGSWSTISSSISGTSKTATGLDCNTTYYFRVSARGDGSPYSTTFGGASGSVSRTTSECQTAPAPTGLTVTSSDRYSVSLSWDSVSDAYRYKLERREGTSGSWSTVSSSISGTSKTATGLDCNTTYYFRVSARGDGSPYSTTFGTPSTTDVSSQTDACLPVFQFSPSPLALGGSSNVWTVPAEVTSVYVDVSFSSGFVKDTGAGDIEINRVDSSDTVLSTLEVDNENDSGTLMGAAAGSLIRIDVENDAFDTSYALVTLTFHSGSDDTGPELARATVQKESRPYSPTAPSTGTSWSVDDAAGSVTLSWGPGAARLGSNPDHYEVVIRDASNPSTPLYSNLNVDDSANPTTLTISGARTLGLEGTHTAEVRHCNTAGGCSLPFSITFTLAPLPDVSAPTLSVDSSTDTAITLSWNSVTGTSKYRLERRTSGSRPIADPWIEVDPEIPSIRTSHTADGLAGGTAYDFQVSAYGDGETHASKWGPWSTTFEASTLPSPTISISGVDTSLGDSDTEDSNDIFTVTASNLISSSTYSITVSTDNDKAAFDSACSERSKSVTFTATSASYTTTFTLYACRPGDVVVTASLGDASSASATQNVTIATRTIPASDVCDDGTVVSDHTSNPGLVSDCENLLLAIGTLKGTANTALNWSSTRVLSDWDGVTVSGSSNRVTKLELSGRGLAGSIPAGLQSLANLQTLDLSNNQLQNNPSPSDVAIPNMRLESLVTLDLSNNQLDGSIPSDLDSYFRNLESLDLSDNDFTGSIPSDLSDLSSLTTLNLSNNQLSGSIPSELGDLSAQVRLSLDGNSLTGCVPASVWHLSNSDSQTLGLSVCSPELSSVGTRWDCPVATNLDSYNDGRNIATGWTNDRAYHKAETDIYRGLSLSTMAALLTNPDAPRSYCLYAVVSNASTRPVTTTLTGTVYSDDLNDVVSDSVSREGSGEEPCTNEPTCIWKSHTMTTPPQVSTLPISSIPDLALWAYGTHQITSGGQTITVRTSRGYTYRTLLWEQPVPPHAPVAFAATTVGASSVTLDWTVESGVAKYRVERSPNGTDSWTILSSEITTVPYTAAAPDCETTYDFRIRALGDGAAYRASWGPLSGPISTTTTACPPSE